MFGQLMSDTPYRAWRYFSEDEIVADLITIRLTKVDKDALCEMEYEQLCKLWLFDRFLVNSYRLDEEAHPLRKAGKRSIDAVTQRIIERVWATLSDKQIPVRTEPVQAKEQEDIHFPSVEYIL